ncbi:HPr family phosphocarrier protein [Temperatibacter marinus]|uniref:HPr family phosphocarrier protein n=1 Tax=Temperatibacter marinus TaxID=1456591 RepID=A0AA52EK00_9PROT|nr:HPr family phosphocarrier protein [Temperatibacter marinus]WND03927.1 HPr family phosphocarrier protein [Temperatibacter marinus]
MISLTATLLNRRGLHARASAKFVRLVEDCDLSVEVTKGATTVNGKSIMGLLMLGAAQGDSITLSLSGPEEESLSQALKALIEDKFGESE